MHRLYNTFAEQNNVFRKLTIFSVIVGRVGGRVQHQCEWDASPFNPCQFQEDLNVVHRFDRKLKFYLNVVCVP